MATAEELIEVVARAICCNGPCYAVALNERAETAANYDHPWHCPRMQYADKARAAIAAIEASGTYRVVPVNPIEAMKNALAVHMFHIEPELAYAAMLAAAPKVIG